jgi:hypothetical protein
MLVRLNGNFDVDTGKGSIYGRRVPVVLTGFTRHQVSLNWLRKLLSTANEK